MSFFLLFCVVNRFRTSPRTGRQLTKENELFVETRSTVGPRMFTTLGQGACQIRKKKINNYKTLFAHYFRSRLQTLIATDNSYRLAYVVHISAYSTLTLDHYTHHNTHQKVIRGVLKRTRGAMYIREYIWGRRCCACLQQRDV